MRYIFYSLLIAVGFFSWLMTAPLAHAAPAFVQATSTETTTPGVNDRKTTFGSNVTSGNLITACGSWGSSASITVTATDTLGNTFQQLVLTSSSAFGFTDVLFYTTSTSSGADAVNIHLGTASTFFRNFVAEFSGVNTFDVSSSSIGNSGAMLSGTSTTNFANEVIFGCGVSANGSNSPGAGFTTATKDSTGELTEYQIVTSTAAYSAPQTAGSSGQYINQMVTFYNFTSPGIGEGQTLVSVSGLTVSGSTFY